MIYYEIYVFSVLGFNRHQAIQGINEVITKNKGCINNESLLILNDTDCQEESVEEIENEKEALMKLENRKTLGAISYYIPGGLITIGFNSYWSQTEKVNCIKLSFPQKLIEDILPNGIDFVVQIAEQTHKKLNALRTIVGFGLRYSDFSWEEELERLKEKNILGEYLRDLRNF